MPSRRPSEPIFSNSAGSSASLASTTSTLRAERGLSPDAKETPLRRPTRPRSSSFSPGVQVYRAPRPSVGDASDAGSIYSSAASSIFTSAAHKASNVLHHRGTPHRSNSAHDSSSNQPSSPLLMSPSTQSIASLAGSGTTRAPPNLYDSTQMKVAIERFENAHKLDGKGGELGSVGAVGFGGDDSWQSVTVKVLPLWNNDPLNGYIEDLNELVQRHIKRILERSPTKAVGYLTEHFQELLVTGMLTLGAKLSYLGDDQLLRKLEEVWVSFFNRILPYLEAIFLPFQTSSDLKRSQRKPATSLQGPLIDVRKLALVAFRDQILMPHAFRLLSILRYAIHLEQSRSDASRRGSMSSTVSSGHTPNASSYRHSLPLDALLGDIGLRMQMLGLVASAQTNDEKQDTVEMLIRASNGDIGILDDQRTVSPSAIDSDSDEDFNAAAHRRSLR